MIILDVILHINHFPTPQALAALAELEKAHENREFLILHLTVDPRFDRLRDDPRYHDLVRRMGFPGT